MNHSSTLSDNIISVFHTDRTALLQKHDPLIHLSMNAALAKLKAADTEGSVKTKYRVVKQKRPNFCGNTLYWPFTHIQVHSPCV